jgi:hypothetical protein
MKQVLLQKAMDARFWEVFGEAGRVDDQMSLRSIRTRKPGTEAQVSGSPRTYRNGPFDFGTDRD